MQHLLAALSEMAHIDDSLAHSLWVLLLPIIWATLGEIKDQQVCAGYFQSRKHASVADGHVAR